MANVMMHNIELKILLVSALVSTFVQDLFTKVIITTVAMLVGTTFAYYWKQYLEKRNNRK